MVACPGNEMQWAERFCQLLPPGFAWEAAGEPGTLMHGRVKVIAGLFDRFHIDACAMPREFVCDTVTDWSRDFWNADYGLPDDCGINDLCFKVAYDGGARCEDIAEIGALLGFEMCCEAVAPEIQPGCWDLGCEAMPPVVEWLEGGIDLGTLSLGFCPPELGIGSPLGDDTLTTLDDDCNIAGYSDVLPAEAIVGEVCPPTERGRRWMPPSNGTFEMCASSYRHDYTGTAYVLRVGVKGSSAVLADPEYAEVGCMEIGCSQLCAPPLPELLCFVERITHAHIKVVAEYC
jgi:hypothetical protein